MSILANLLIVSVNPVKIKTMTNNGQQDWTVSMLIYRVYAWTWYFLANNSNNDKTTRMQQQAWKKNIFFIFL
jgi:hypothetical protein